MAETAQTTPTAAASVTTSPPAVAPAPQPMQQPVYLVVPQPPQAAYHPAYYPAQHPPVYPPQYVAQPVNQPPSGGMGVGAGIVLGLAIVGVLAIFGLLLASSTWSPLRSNSMSPFIAAAPAGHTFVGATKGAHGQSCEQRGGQIVPDTTKEMVKTPKGWARPNKCTAD